MDEGWPGVAAGVDERGPLVDHPAPFDANQGDLHDPVGRRRQPGRLHVHYDERHLTQVDTSASAR
ncbi:hypothetical protein AB0B27_25175 [Micromonospora rifamycinica]|uniref:hypothetical protein n=1 Tax=Micromonospora rifamycinica TaxID=291594 RepID=UPI0033F1837C